jgi:biopolymer transport protein ExbB/TolQ
MEWLNFIVACNWVLLAGLSYLGAHAIIERCLYHFWNRPAAPDDLDMLLARLRGERIQYPLAWLNLGCLQRPVELANGDRWLLASLLHEEQRQALRFREFLVMAANAATAAGLLGTVLALAKTSGGNDPSAILGLGIITTVYGLVIAIPCTFAHHLLSTRGEKIADQIDEVLDVLNKPRRGRRQNNSREEP